jgi:hypothetical protein
MGNMMKGEGVDMMKDSVMSMVCYTPWWKDGKMMNHMMQIMHKGRPWWVCMWIQYMKMMNDKGMNGDMQN